MTLDSGSDAEAEYGSSQLYYTLPDSFAPDFGMPPCCVAHRCRRLRNHPMRLFSLSPLGPITVSLCRVYIYERLVVFKDKWSTLFRCSFDSKKRRRETILRECITCAYPCCRIFFKIKFFVCSKKLITHYQSGGRLSSSFISCIDKHLIFKKGKREKKRGTRTCSR